MSRRKRKRQPKKKQPATKQKKPQAAPAVVVTPRDTGGSKLEAVEAADNDQKTHHSNQHDGSVANGPVVWEFWFAAALVVFTGLQATFAIFQWDAMNAQNEIMIGQNKAIEKQVKLAEAQLEQMRLEQRAWLGILQGEITEIKQGEPIQVVIPVRNTGHTPGTIIATTFKIFTRPASEDIQNIIDVITPQKSERESMVSPGGVVRFPAETPERLSQDILDAVNNGTRSIYVAGAFIYQDVLGEERTTRYCLIYMPKTKSLVEYLRHNRMD